jgi:hypothetical protein
MKLLKINDEVSNLILNLFEEVEEDKRIIQQVINLNRKKKDISLI